MPSGFALSRSAFRGICTTIVRIAVQRVVSASWPFSYRRSTQATRKLSGDARMTLETHGG
jgi:hypothetical protein